MNKQEIEKMNKEFPITSVCRFDVAETIHDEKTSEEEAEKIALALTDEEMHDLANDIADALCDGDLWIVIQEWLEKEKKI